MCLGTSALSLLRACRQPSGTSVVIYKRQRSQRVPSQGRRGHSGTDLPHLPQLVSGCFRALIPRNTARFQPAVPEFYSALYSPRGLDLSLSGPQSPFLPMSV